MATVLAFVVTASVNAQAPAVRRGTAEDSLRGFNAFYVGAFVSEHISSLVPAAALTRDIEEQLRRRGLTVAVQGNEPLPLSPTVIVDIDAIPLADGTIVYTARVDFRRQVQVASTSTIKLAAHDLVDRFLNLHARANR